MSAENKIDILYIVREAPGVSYQMLMDKCIGTLLIDFFTFSEVYNDLLSAGLISKVMSDTGTGEVIGLNETLYITDGGRAILSDLEVTINPQMKINLDNLAAKLRSEVAEMGRIKAVSERLSDGRFRVDLACDDFRASFTVSGPAEADSVIKAFRSRGASVTAAFISDLQGN